MPAFTSSCAFIYFLLAAGAVNVIVMDPARNDMVAALGALFAAAIVVFDFQSKMPSRRKLSQFMPVFIACGVVGSIGPGLTINWFFYDSLMRITWHGWAGMGFAYGLGGWVFVKWVMRFLNRYIDVFLDGATDGVVDGIVRKWKKSPDSRDGDTKKLEP